MKNIRDTCVEFFQSEDIRKSVKEIIKPIANIVYNEMYLYIWIILFYNVFLIFLILANLGLLIKLLQMQGTVSSLSTALPQINI
jgi:hypothetical protein